MRTLLLCFASFVMVLFGAPIISAQSLDGKVETENDSTVTYEFDDTNKNQAPDGEYVDGKDLERYDERDILMDEGEEEESPGRSIDPLNNPEAFQQCPDCNKIKNELDETKKELEKLENGEEALDKKIDETNKSIDEANGALDDAKKALNDFQNPKSYAESEGNRVDSSDLDAKRWAYGNAWTAYQNGAMTAQELEDFWENFDDADLQKAKEGYEKELQKEIEKAEKAVKDAQAAKKRLEDQKAKVDKAIEAAKKKVERLEKQLEDCLKKCGPSAIDSFFDIFYRVNMPDLPRVIDHTNGLLGLPLPTPPNPILPPLPELPPGEFEPDSFFDVFFDIEIPEDPAQIPQDQKEAVENRVGGGSDFQVDSFFDIAYELDFPESSVEGEIPTEMETLDLTGPQPIPVAVCPKCQPILDKLNATKKSIVAMKNAQKALQAKSGKLDQGINKAQGRVENLKQALDRMENPDSWAEAEGRRVDSADLEARRAAFADAWGRYQGGQMTAQELEDYWNNFDDAERNKWKEKVKNQLKQKIKDAEKAVKDLKAEKAKVEKEIADLQGKIEAAEKEVEQLQKDYDECVKKCKTPNTQPSFMDGLGAFLEKLVGQSKSSDPIDIIEEAIDLLTSPPIVLPAPADDVAPNDSSDSESRMIVFENLNITVPKGETIEFTLPNTTQEQIEYLKVKMEDVIISDTSAGSDGEEGGGPTINPDALLPAPEISTDGKGKLTISNIGSSGEDGVSIDLDETAIKDQVINPNPSGNDYLEGFDIDTSGIGGLGGAQIIGFDKDGERVVLRDNIRITPEEDGGARIEFDTPVIVSPGQPVDVIIPAKIEKDTNAELVIDLPEDQFLPSEVDPYRFETGPRGGVLNGSGVSQGTGNVFLPESGSPEPPIFRFDPDGNLNPNRDLVLPEGWSQDIENPFVIPPAGFDPVFDLSQGLQSGNINRDENGNMVVSNIGSSGEDGVQIELGDTGEGFAQDGKRNPEDTGGGIFNNGGTVNVNPDGTFTYNPPKNLFGTDRFEYAQIGHGGTDFSGGEEVETDFFRPLLLQFPEDLGRKSLPELDFGIIGPSTFIPIDPRGIDGRPGLSMQDLSGLNNCIANGGSSCNGLDVGPPVGVNGVPFGGGIDPSGFEIIAGPPGGGDFEWNTVPGNEGGGLWNSDGPNASRPVTDNFFDAQTGTLQGADFDDQGGGGIFNNGGGIFNQGGPDAGFNFFGNGGPGGINDLGLPPGTVPGLPQFDPNAGLDVNGGSLLGEDILAPDTPPAPRTTRNLPPQVQTLIRKIIQQNPPGPCDELIIDVTRVRIGNKYEFTITARMQKKPNCPPSDDILIGSPNDDLLLNPGNDTITGNPGDDVLQGTGGDDLLIGDDIINGTGDTITTDGFDSGHTDRWTEGRDFGSTTSPEPEPPTREEICIIGGHFADDFCDGQCSPTQQVCSPIRHMNQECFTCETVCTSDEIYGKRLCESACPGTCEPHGNEGCYKCNLPEEDLVSPCLQQGAYPTNSCNDQCSSEQECVRAETDDECYACQDKPSFCPIGSFGRENCSQCDAGCEPVPNADNLSCYKCKEPVVEECVPDCYGKMCGDDGCGGSCGQCDAGVPCTSDGRCESEVICPANSYEVNGDCTSCPSGCTSSTGSVGLDACTCPTEETAQCPSGTTADRAGCNEACTNGVCLQTAIAGETECVQCYQCPSDMFTDQGTCESEGGQACEVGATSGSMQCWKPMPSCEDACTQYGFSASPIDFTAEVESQLNAVSCVSSYQMQIQQATVGNCTCHPTEAPQITFDRTPPICAGTVCGDVACGESISCATGENQTTTVTCNWGGWQKEALYKYRPILGGQ